MAIDSLSYTGINRAYSDFAGTRACEELINLRPTSEGVVPVKEALERMSNVPYHKVFVHYTTSGPNYIAIGRTNADVYAKYLVYDEVNEVWTVADTLFSVSAPNPSAAVELLDKVYYAYAGNILTFSLCDPANNVFQNRSFTWNGSAYVLSEGTIPGVNINFTPTPTLETVSEEVSPIVPSTNPVEIPSIIDNAFSAAQEHNPSLCFGPVIIALAFKTKDGSTFWTNGWKVYDPRPAVNLDGTYHVYASSSWAGSALLALKGFFTKYPEGGYALSGTAAEQYDAIRRLYFEGSKVTVTISRIQNWNPDTSILQSVEVYCSRPQPYFDSSKASDGWAPTTPEMQTQSLPQYLALPESDYSEMDLGGQILYHQASVPLASLVQADQPVSLSFGGNAQVTEDILDTDAGAVKRYGRLLSYNARFHFYDSFSNIEIGMPSFTETTSGSRTRMVFVRYADDDQSELLYVGNNTVHDTYDYTPQFIIAPSISVKEVMTAVSTGGGYSVKKYRMDASSAYNYTINEGKPYFDNTLSASEWASSELKRAYDAGRKTGVWNKEPDAINVSEQYNPFVFLVEHSYKAPGNILDIQTQMAGITDTSYGRDPLNVFTERGTYALTQGSANVLYGAFLPVSNSVISRKGGSGSLPTEMGVFFLADGALWLLTGRRATLISDALHLGPHKYIRDCDGYKKISGGGLATPEYDVSGLVSSVTFEEYVRSGGRLGFNRFRMELYVSNKAYSYTYVLSLKYRQWFKVGKCLWQDDPSGNLISTPGEHGLMTILDLSTETDWNVLVHLQSRPFSMGYRYIHMHRIVSMVRAKLSAIEGEKIVVGLYGSDDLQNWKLLAYAKRTGTDAQTEDDPPVVTGRPLKVSQIRTTPSSRSWRYYTICIGGIVPTDTDIGPVLVDYEPVIRRIG